MMRRCSLLLAVLTLTGCSTLAPRFATDSARDVEMGWAVLHTIDTLQTMQIARHPACLHESNPLAVAVYGTKHPSVGRVLITNVLMGAAHVAASAWLDRRAQTHGGRWRTARTVSQVVSIGGSGLAVGGNLRRGILPMGKLRCAP